MSGWQALRAANLLALRSVLDLAWCLELDMG
jgi:hypothetical protein